MWLNLSIINLDFPGREKKDIKLKLQNNILYISSDKKREVIYNNKTYFYQKQLNLINNIMKGLS